MKKSSHTESRILIAPVRSYPTAVARNKAKRLVRECWRLGKQEICGGYDVAVVVFPGYDELDQRRDQFDCLFRQAGLKVRRT